MTIGAQAEKEPMVWYLAGKVDLILFPEGRGQVEGQFGVGMQISSQLSWGPIMRRHGMGWGWEKGGPPSSPYQYTGTPKSSLEWEGGVGSFLLPNLQS